MRTALHEAITAFLERENKSAGEWALDLGITPSHLSRILAGERLPTLPLAIRMSRETGVPIELFVPNAGVGQATA